MPKSEPAPKKDPKVDPNAAERAQQKADAFTHYGASCKKCGITDQRVLSFVRKVGNSPAAVEVLPRILKLKNWPSDYEVLCANCQLLKKLE